MIVRARAREREKEKRMKGQTKWGGERLDSGCAGAYNYTQAVNRQRYICRHFDAALGAFRPFGSSPAAGRTMLCLRLLIEWMDYLALPVEFRPYEYTVVRLKLWRIRTELNRSSVCLSVRPPACLTECLALLSKIFAFCLSPLIK